MKEIKEWLNTYIRNEFNKDTEYLYKLSPANLFYLYIEIYRKYDIKIEPGDIRKGCFDSIDSLSIVIKQYLESKKL